VPAAARTADFFKHFDISQVIWRQTLLWLLDDACHENARQRQERTRCLITVRGLQMFVAD